MDERISRLRALLVEEEAWAVAASMTREPGTPAGEHWQWECRVCDTVIRPDPVVDRHLRCPDCGSYGVGLRSRETYGIQTTVGGLPSFPGGHSEEVSSVAAEHIVRHDPARMLRRIAAIRAILDAVETWKHDYNDMDTWYSCPLSVDPYYGGSGCSNDYAGNECDCGLEGRLDAILNPLLAAYSS